jgi:hypothetical protein
MIDKPQISSHRNLQVNFCEVPSPFGQEKIMNDRNNAASTDLGFERTFRPIEAARPDADRAYTRATEVCWLDSDIKAALVAVNAAFLKLCSAAAPAHFLSIAMERAGDVSPAAVATALGEIRNRLISELDVVREELAAWNSNHTAELSKNRCHQLAADDALRSAEAQLLSVRNRLTAAPADQIASQKKMTDAGLSKADIAKIGFKPSVEDVNAWSAEADVLKAQIERIKKFFAGRPFYDVAILQDADLATLGTWQERLHHKGH